MVISPFGSFFLFKIGRRTCPCPIIFGSEKPSSNARISKPTGLPPVYKKGDVPRRIGRTKGGLNSKLHAACDGTGRPIIFHLTEGQMSDHKGAAIIYPRLPTADMLIGDKGYDSDAFRGALTKHGITPCITPRAKRRLPATYCGALYKQRHKIENTFARLKDWRRISMRYDRCAHTFFSAICIAATVIFWINQ